MSKPEMPPESPAGSPVSVFARRRVLFAVATLTAVAVAWLAWQRAGAQDDKNGKRGRQTPTVSVATAATGDMRVSLDALGTVTANNTVVVKSRVDGQLEKLYFKEGQEVRAGQVLAQIDPRPFAVQVTQAEGQLARDMAQLANARADLARYRTLLEQNGASRQQVDTQEALVRQLAGTVKVDEGAVAAARLQLSYCRIVAPVSGKAGLKQVDEGNMIRASDASGLVVITQVRPANVVFSIPETRLDDLIRARAANPSLPVEARDRDGSTLLARGELLTADNQVDTATGTLKLKARFDNRDDVLFPNRFVNVRMLLATRKNVLLVPSAAVQQGKPGSYVFVVNADKTVSLRPVKTGPSENERTVIESGLAVGERVALDGLDQLRDGKKVNPVGQGERHAPDASAPLGEKQNKAA
ncbi:MdtA/MuxA family multidrug efflux RND transporter periplasmic adaptor subunit [Paludibacterium paludis]|uniref:Multidrug transporter n=1 Tax=Paludibacterium paludis TaxID=1225769 RepID=A0A918U8N1_9NEIS|nr:MdtA/MuxA family multidrug efflux RND transporter periplasmic adaptor subunit [Paludibacterium paludis]GGY12130.1 multidrug transporter [Paludibacterium paludis]